VIVIVAGFEAEATRRLSQELRAAGHQVLGAQGRHGTRTFLHATSPDVVVVPTGDVAKVREWTADLGMTLALVEVPAGAPDGLGVVALRRFAGEPEPAVEEPAVEDEHEDEDEDEDEDDSDYEDDAEVVVETGAEPMVEPPPLPRAPETRDTGRTSRPVAGAGAAPPGVVVEPHPDLVAKLAQVRFADYFQILEVEPSGSIYQARDAEQRLARRFSPRGWSGRLMPEELDMLDEIARGLADAALVLTDPDLRARYERGLGGAAAPRRATRE